jgi:hypothetical protein
MRRNLDEANSGRVARHRLEDDVGAGVIAAATAKNAADDGSPGTSS